MNIKVLEKQSTPIVQGDCWGVLRRRMKFGQPYQIKSAIQAHAQQITCGRNSFAEYQNKHQQTVPI